VTAAAEKVRAAVAERLRARRGEIEEATLTRVYGVSRPAETADPEYAHGLRAAVAAALDYGLDALERSEQRAPPIPTALLAQARLAAREGVKLETVLRRYLAGYTLLGDFVIQEVEERGPFEGVALKRLLRAQATLFDDLVVVISEEYGRESEGWIRSHEQRRVEHVKRLLAGELLDSDELRYELDDWHLGVIATGPGVTEAIRGLADALDRRLLMVRPGEGSVWAWLGGRHKPSVCEVLELATSSWPAQATLAVGEAGRELGGWRLTHRQARAALSIAQRGSEGQVRYADVALLASALRDDVLADSLNDLYIAPLSGERDGGEALRQTLGAYFAAGCHVSSAAAALDVSRQTVNSRLRAVEERVGRPLSSCTAEIETALRLEGLSKRQIR
jgi:hypothetical protein